MMNYIWLISIVVVLPLFYMVQKNDYLLVNRLFLKNRHFTRPNTTIRFTINETIWFLNSYKPYEYSDINIKQISPNTQLLEAKLFIVDKNVDAVNPIERKIVVQGYKVADKFFTKSVKDENSQDLGAIIPSPSNIPLNKLYKSRSWENQKKCWDKYRKNWSVKWADKPIR